MATVHSLPVEIWRKILNYLDYWDKWKVSQTCRFLNQLLFENSLTTFIATVGISPEVVYKQFFVQKYHRLSDEEAMSSNGNQFDLVRSCKALNTIFLFENAAQVVNFYSVHPHPFHLIQNLHFFFDPSIKTDLLLNLTLFTELRTLDLFQINAAPSKFARDDALTLPKLTKLQMIGFELENLIEVCPNLESLYCSPSQWKLLVDSYKQVATKTILNAGKLKEVHIFCRTNADLQQMLQFDFSSSVLPIKKFKITFEHNLTMDSLPMPTPYENIYFNFKQNPMDLEHQKPIIDAFVLLNSQFDLNQKAVFINALRLTPDLQTSELAYFLDNFVSCRDSLKSFVFNRLSADCLRSEILASHCNPINYSDKAFNRLDFGFLTSLWLYQYETQVILNRISLFFPLLTELCFFEICENYVKPKCDLSFLAELKALRRIKLCSFDLEDMSTLKFAIKQLPYLTVLDCFLDLTHEETIQIIRAVESKILKFGNMRSFQLTFSECEYFIPRTSYSNQINLGFTNPYIYLRE